MRPSLFVREGRTLSRIGTTLGIVITLAAWAGAALHDEGIFIAAVAEHDGLAAARAFLYLSLITVLVYGSLVYLFARWGYLKRLSTHRAASAAELDAFRLGAAPSVTILVPSYKEDPGIVRKTLLSAALQDYPRRSVVLLIDDPPVPATRDEAMALEAVRKVPAEIEQLLAPMRMRTASALAEFEAGLPAPADRLAVEGRRLANLVQELGEWLADQARRHEIRDHSDRLFVELTFLIPARKLSQEAVALAGHAAAGPLDAESMHAHYRRLVQRFDVTLRSFERKAYANLSHEPNKAMNLNSYIGLMGGSFEEQRDGGQLLLVPADSSERALVFLNSDYVLILDADSLVHPEYTLRLAHRLGLPDHERVAVIQTPYSAFPEAPGALERVAGATTDIQYQIHQGFTHYRATFWVGANAMVRARALQEIAQRRQERGFTVGVFIDDRTVIEDTGSTIDLRRRGWQLHSYPERLAFSATPPDFGSLLIQRRRWANGGLLIIPTLWRAIWRHGGPRMTLSEVVFRFHYLTSLAASNLALLILLAYGFDDRLASAWLPVTAVPYYLLYAVDLRRAGYRCRDVFRVYALNMILIPVSLGGVLNSLKQACTGRRSAFGRTPKIVDRTAAPSGYVLAEGLLFALWLVGAVIDALHGRWLNAGFGLGNATVLLYGLVRFIGVRAACEDVAPLGRAVRQQCVTLKAACLLTARRLATPALVALALVLRPAAAAGSELAVTLDDLPTHGPLPPGSTRERLVEDAIAVLKRYRIVGAVGFVNGAQLRAAPEHEEILARWVKAGYTLGNHTFSHSDLHRLDAREYLADVDENESVLGRYAAADAVRLFRYPYLHEGDTLDKRAVVRAGLRARGYAITQVTVDFFDWAWNDAYARCLRTENTEAIAELKRSFVRRALEALDSSERSAESLIGRPIKHILLLHLGAFDVLMLDDLLAAYQHHGVRFVSVADAMTDPIYGIDPNVTSRGQASLLQQLLQATGRQRMSRPRPLPFGEIQAACR
jgi:cellulose synthase/poly-beta-1,6-N-acetylglucosamine synthase-like glycosyltransferase/peptidoglycan/xylan/chitin deacetylase (PgdA/CDA1 family)